MSNMPPATAKRRQPLAQLWHAERHQRLVVVLAAGDIQEARPRHVGQLAADVAGQAEADVVFAHQDPAGVLHGLRLAVAEPGPERGGLAGPDALHDPRQYRAIGAIGIPAGDIIFRPRVGRDDPVADRLAPAVDQVEAVAVAGASHAGDLIPRNARGRKHRSDGLGRSLPESLHVALEVAGLGREHLGLATGGGHFAAVHRKQGRLGHRAAVVGSEQVLTHGILALVIRRCFQEGILPFGR
jgi:hypothetical protein